jgi:hypothetical protein
LFENIVLEQFSPDQLTQLEKMLALARELTGEYYHLSQDEAGQIPYEIRTLRDLEESEIGHDGILADVARYQYQDSRFGRNRDLYRVNLQDHNILKRIKEGKIQFAALVLYILTHEIIHVVRFVKFMVPFHLEHKEREAEEQRVHGITRKLLVKVPIEGIGEVLDNYQSMSSRDFL